MSARPVRGEIWLTNFGVPVGHEVGFRRPAVVVSSDRLNRIGAVTVMVPITSRERHLPTHVRIPARRGTGLTADSWAKVDDIKSVSTDRLEEHLGEVDRLTLSRVEEALRMVLDM